MIRRLALLTSALLLSGCVRQERCAVLHSESPGRTGANLTLARSPDTAQLATLLTARADWPSVEHGLRLEDVTYYSRTYYSEQTYYDRYGGLLDLSDAQQTGVWLR